MWEGGGVGVKFNYVRAKFYFIEKKPFEENFIQSIINHCCKHYRNLDE